MWIRIRNTGCGSGSFCLKNRILNVFRIRNIKRERQKVSKTQLKIFHVKIKNYMTTFWATLLLITSVADPGCLSRDPDFYPFRIPDLRSRIQKQQQKRVGEK